MPADGILIQSNDLKVDESSLTGESDHVKKGELFDPMVLSGERTFDKTSRFSISNHYRSRKGHSPKLYRKLFALRSRTIVAKIHCIAVKVRT